MLDFIHRKNMDVYSKARLDDGWKSLGIESGSGENVTANFSPTLGSAGYYYAGLEEFRAFLQDKSGKTVQLGKRIFATSLAAPPQAVITKQVEAEVWFREMLEPTISVIPSRKELGTRDAAKHNEDEEVARKEKGDVEDVEERDKIHTR